MIKMTGLDGIQKWLFFEGMMMMDLDPKMSLD